jgi:hypothetical protein
VVGIDLTTNLHLVESLKFIGDISQLSLYAYRSGTGKILLSLSILQAKSAFAQHFSNAGQFSGIVNIMKHITPICESGHPFCLGLDTKRDWMGVRQL